MGPRRMGRPGLLRTMARTTVIAGTATAVAGSVSHNQQQKYAAEEAAQQPVNAAPAEVDVYTEIEKFGKLKDQGYITQEEFEAKKRSLLGL